jgi:hypothetical protein
MNRSIPRLTLLLACAACGSRSGLLTGQVTDSGEPPVTTHRCTAPPPAEPLPVSQGQQMVDRAVLTSSGCSYAVVWAGMGPMGGDTLIEAAIIRVVDGAWQTLPPVVVADAGNDLADAWIAWSGTEYVVLWDDGSNLNLRLMAEDGTFPGAPTTLFPFPPTSYLEGVAASEDGVVRLGVGLAVEPYLPKGYFAKVTVTGDVLLPPTLVTPPAQSTGAAFLLEGPGRHLVLSAGDEPPAATEYLTLSAFDDDGTVSEATPLATSMSSFYQVGDQAITTVGPDLYYAWSESSGNPPFATYLDDVTRGTRLKLPPGGTPDIAPLGDLTLGVLTIPEGSQTEVGFLSVKDGAARGPPLSVYANASLLSANSFWISPGKESVGVAWNTDSAVYFTVVPSER